MPIVSMTDAVSGQVASAAEYNKVTSNIRDLDTRVTSNTTSVSTNTTSINTLNTRTTDASTGNTALGTRVTTLESQARGGAYYGSWRDAGGNTGGQTITNGTGGGESGVKITDINTAIETAVGCSFASGTFTATQAGVWIFHVTMQYVGSNSNQRALYIAKSNAANSPTGTKFGLVGAPSMDSQATSGRIKLAANEQVSVYAACWSTGSIQIWKAQGCTFTATWIGP